MPTRGSLFPSRERHLPTQVPASATIARRKKQTCTTSSRTVEPASCRRFLLVLAAGRNLTSRNSRQHLPHQRASAPHSSALTTAAPSAPEASKSPPSGLPSNPPAQLYHAQSDPAPPIPPCRARTDSATPARYPSPGTTSAPAAATSHRCRAK